MSFTASQIEAIQSAGNIIVEAGAGAGKTKTLVERCIEQIRAATEPGALQRMLVVPFREAAAAEVRRRIREELEKKSAEPGNSRWDEELASIDSANICTLHSF